jgi:hypothetical protein
VRKAYPIIVLLIISAILVFAFVPISNTIGPFRIHVKKSSQQLLELSAVNTPPGEISLGNTVNITIRVRNLVSNEVAGHLIVNVTASDFTVTSRDVSVKLDTTGNFGHYGGITGFHLAKEIQGGVMLCSDAEFIWPANCDQSAVLLFSFYKANPTDTGYYEISIGISQPSS